MAAKKKTKRFEIPKHWIGSFFNQLDDTDLHFKLIEIDEENNELIIEVEYSPDERDEVMNLIEVLDEWYEEEEEEEVEED